MCVCVGFGKCGSVYVLVLLCMGVCMCWFCKMWVCVCVNFTCGCLYVLVLQIVGVCMCCFVKCGCVYVLFCKVWVCVCVGVVCVGVCMC